MRHLTATLTLMWMLAGSAAWAGKRTLVFPFKVSGLPGEVAGAAEAMTRALADSIEGSVAKVPIEDAAELLGCDVEITECLEKVAASLNARRLVFGTLSSGAGTTLKVTLTRFDLGPARQQRTFELEGQSSEYANELVSAAAPLFESVAAGPTETEPSPPDEPPPRETRGGQITPSTWVLIGGGAVAGLVGAGFLVSAHGLRDEVATAPKHTDADFDRLVELESRGKTRAYVGDALVIAGGIVAAVGVVRAILQRSSTRSERQTVRIEPVPVHGGAAVVLTVGMP